MSLRSRGSNESPSSSKRSATQNMNSEIKDRASLRKKPTKRNNDSQQRRRLEQKLVAYYQSLVQPCEEWGPDYGVQKMLDGADVDAQISKKRAHKIILAEAFDQENKSRFKISKKQRTKAVAKKKETDDMDEK